MSEKLGRMWWDRDFVDLTLVAAFYMGAVRAMLSNISFVYEDYYKMDSFATGVLISVPTLCGFFSSMAALAVVHRVSTTTMLRVGMMVAWLSPIAMILAAGSPRCTDCPYDQHQAIVAGQSTGWGSSWWVTTLCVALMSSTGFFTLPAMQTVVMQDLKDISGLAGGLSKMVMQFISTGMSVVASYVFTHDPATGEVDDAHHDPPIYTHYHTQRLLYTLGAALLVCQVYFWVFYQGLWPLCCKTKPTTPVNHSEPLLDPAAEAEAEAVDEEANLAGDVEQGPEQK